MRITYIGCKTMGYECLEYLLDSKKNVISVYTLHPSLAPKTAGFKPFDELLMNTNIPLYKVENINAPEVVERIKKGTPDLILQIAWSQIIKEEVLNIPPKGTVGFHASLLPKYRGGSPVNWAIINDEKEWGTTFFYMTPGLDDGDIIAQEKFNIELGDTCKTVYEKVTRADIEILKEYLPLLEKDMAPRIKQDESKATYVRRRKPEDGIIDWNKPAYDIYNWVRALTHPYPGAFTYYKGNKLYIWEAGLSGIDTANIKLGQIVGTAENGFVAATRTKGLIIKEVQIENDEEIYAAKFVEKYGLQEGIVFGEMK